MDKIFTYKELEELINGKDELLGSGALGIVRPIDNYTLIKYYRADVKPKNIDMTIEKINFKKEQLKEALRRSPNYETREKKIIKARRALLKTKYSKSLIRGIAYYDDYAFGVLLSWYKNYFTMMDKELKNLSLSERTQLMDNLDMVLEDFISNNIFPIDMKESNIMFNPRTLDVKFIDLDDGLCKFLDSKVTLYETKCMEKRNKIRNRLMKI